LVRKESKTIVIVENLGTEPISIVPEVSDAPNIDEVLS